MNIFRFLSFNPLFSRSSFNKGLFYIIYYFIWVYFFYLKAEMYITCTALHFYVQFIITCNVALPSIWMQIYHWCIILVTGVDVADIGNAEREAEIHMDGASVYYQLLPDCKRMWSSAFPMTPQHPLMIVSDKYRDNSKYVALLVQVHLNSYISCLPFPGLDVVVCVHAHLAFYS